MLDNVKTMLLRNKGIDDDEIVKIDSFDETTGIVVYKDGRQRQTTDVFLRIMGYLRRIEDANIGKRQEMKDRVYFNQKKSIEKCRIKEQLVAE